MRISRQYVFLFLVIALIGFSATSQNYVDLFRISYGESFSNEFEGTPFDTNVDALEASLTIPIPLNDKHALVTGVEFVKSDLQLLPQGPFVDLYSTTLKLGWAATYNEKWSSTIVFLPKLASDYQNITGDDYYFGGYAVAKLQKKENLIYRFGLYASTEAFGIFGVPIVGWYYLSPNERFEMDMSLPISADINYALGMFTVGVDYFGIGRSYNVDSGGLADVYVQQGALDFGTYLQWNGFDKSVLIRGKIGYTSNDFELYADGDDFDLGLASIRFGDDRIRLNPEISGGLFFKFEAIYRFNLPGEDSPEE